LDKRLLQGFGKRRSHITAEGFPMGQDGLVDDPEAFPVSMKQSVEKPLYHSMESFVAGLGAIPRQV